MGAFLSVLIFILKLILSVLAVIVMLIAIILLSPIPYRINCIYNDDNKLNADIKLTWLWKLVVFKYCYQNDNGEVFFRIGWKKIIDSAKKEDSKNSKEDSNGKILKENRDSDTKRTEAEIEEEIKSDTNYQNDNSEDEYDSKEKDKFNKFSSFFRKIKQAYEYPDRNEIIRESKVFLFRFWRSIKPKKFKLICLVGFDSPDTTGYVLALAGVASTYMKKSHIFNVTGDFDKKVLNINLFTLGKTSLLKLLIPLARYVFSKPIWKIVKLKFKK